MFLPYSTKATILSLWGCGILGSDAHVRLHVVADVSEKFNAPNSLLRGVTIQEIATRIFTTAKISRLIEAFSALWLHAGTTFSSKLSSKCEQRTQCVVHAVRAGTVHRNSLHLQDDFTRLKKPFRKRSSLPNTPYQYRKFNIYIILSLLLLCLY
jgi:hypothetical protein